MTKIIVQCISYLIFLVMKKKIIVILGANI